MQTQIAISIIRAAIYIGIHQQSIGRDPVRKFHATAIRWHAGAATDEEVLAASTAIASDDVEPMGNSIRNYFPPRFQVTRLNDTSIVRVSWPRKPAKWKH